MSRWPRGARALALAGVLAGLAAEAQESPWRLSVEASTDFPLNVGARLGVEGPGRLLLSTSVGYLPPPYLRAINTVVVGLGGYDERVAELIERGLEQGLVWRTHLGWRPFAGAGFYVAGGYSLLALSGESSPEEVLLALTGLPGPSGEESPGRRYDVSSTLHLLDAELGWRWLVGERLLVRTAVGGTFTLAASSRVEPRFQPTFPPATSLFTSLAERYLDDTYERHVHFPVLSLSVGYTF